ncbi:MAG: hypothetical protein Q9219_002615 [cf. Caloplaca sp. 3 TL-2023]
MSHYINSLLIEPVVRQARRFSRPSNDESSPQPVGRQLTAEDQAEASQGEERLPVMVTWGVNSRHLVSHIPTPSTIEPEALTLDSDQDIPEVASPTRRNRQQHDIPPRRPGTSPERALGILDQPSQLRSTESPVSNNPVYGVPESLRSTTSSLSNSAQMTTHSDSRNIQDSTRSMRRNSQGDEVHPYEKRSRRLPADDGMSLMRKRIIAIQRTNSSNTEKAKMIHDLMSEQYNSSQSSLQAAQPVRAHSPTSLASHERPITPASSRSVDNSIHCTSPPTSLSSVAETSNPFNLTPDDLRPTFHQTSRTNPAASAVQGTIAASANYGMTTLEKERTFIIARPAARSIVNMEMQFRHLERAIESQPMPPEFRDTKAWVYCNDCNSKSSVKYHWLGLKCGVCDSYNTAQLQMIHGSDQTDLLLGSEQPTPESQARGRNSEISSQMQRITNSAPPAAGIPSAEGRFESVRRTAHSQEPHPIIHLPLSSDSTEDPMSAYMAGYVEEDEEYSDDVDFWGLGGRHGPLAPLSLGHQVPSTSSSDEDEDEDDSDEEMSDEEPGEDDEEDQMEIFGHR